MAGGPARPDTSHIWKAIMSAEPVNIQYTIRRLSGDACASVVRTIAQVPGPGGIRAIRQYASDESALSRMNGQKRLSNGYEAGVMTSRPPM